MAIADQEQAATRQLMAAMAMPAPRLYANTFLLAQSLSDITVVLQTNGTTVGVLSLSFTSAKTLGLQLQQVVKTFEEATGQKLLTMFEIEEATMKSKGDSNVSV